MTVKSKERMIIGTIGCVAILGIIFVRHCAVYPDQITYGRGWKMTSTYIGYGLFFVLIPSSLVCIVVLCAQSCCAPFAGVFACTYVLFTALCLGVHYYSRSFMALEDNVASRVYYMIRRYTPYISWILALLLTLLIQGIKVIWSRKSVQSKPMGTDTLSRNAQPIGNDRVAE